MANVTTLPNVLVLDTAADNIVAAATKVKVKMVTFAGPTAAGKAEITDAGGTVSKITLAAGASGDAQRRFESAFTLNGLRLLSVAAGAVVHVYVDAG